METLWQESENAVWFSNEKQTCSVCGKKNDKVVELAFSDGSDRIRCCFLSKKDCLRTGTSMQFAKCDDDYLLTRLIEYKPIGAKSEKREPVGLSKRYQVLKRDGFQCVLCGASGKAARLEIDHKVPVSAGGGSGMEDLQTLCFNCNRGKGATA